MSCDLKNVDFCVLAGKSLSFMRGESFFVSANTQVGDL